MDPARWRNSIKQVILLRSVASQRSAVPCRVSVTDGGPVYERHLSCLCSLGGASLMVNVPPIFAWFPCFDTQTRPHSLIWISLSVARAAVPPFYASLCLKSTTAQPGPWGWESPARGGGHGAMMAPCRRTNRRLRLCLSRRSRHGGRAVGSLGGEEQTLRRCSRHGSRPSRPSGGESPAPEGTTTMPPGDAQRKRGRHRLQADTVPNHPAPRPLPFPTTARRRGRRAASPFFCGRARVRHGAVV
jgi:hypothetical protein